jgi:GT2 family glycosyltransferase
MSAGGPPVVSVTVVLHNSERGLADCIRSIRPELDDGFAELIAVDNASPDESVEIIERVAPEARVVRSPQNRGFAAGANRAWASVRGRYWMLLNPDVVLDPGGIRELATWMDRHPTIGSASAELTDGDGGGPRSAGRAVPTAWRALLEASRLHLLLPRGLRGRVLRGAYWVGGDQLDAGWIPATAMMVRREAVEQAGLLDESFFLYGEDIEWCWRIRDTGWSLGVCSSVAGRHREGSSAVRTMGDAETRARMARGEVEAVRAARGARYARLYAYATALALRLEALHPGRAPERRRGSREAARLWMRAARGTSR